mmetsp:Transcript_100357/g.178374  ORF Transcript_100357/g.178374 Transcript_100357/m.178374 type:complete len:176 (+) Transcript_100357:57-584(+)
MKLAALSLLLNLAIAAKVHIATKNASVISCGCGGTRTCQDFQCSVGDSNANPCFVWVNGACQCIDANVGSATTNGVDARSVCLNAWGGVWCGHTVVDGPNSPWGSSMGSPANECVSTDSERQNKTACRMCSQNCTVGNCYMPRQSAYGGQCECIDVAGSTGDCRTEFALGASCAR